MPCPQYQCTRKETVIQPLLCSQNRGHADRRTSQIELAIFQLIDAAGELRASPFLQTQELQANARCAYRAGRRYFNIRRVKQ